MTSLDTCNCYNTSFFSLNGMTFRAKVAGVYDGDTLTGIIEIFPGQFCQVKFRLLGIDTPELIGERHDLGIKARDRVLNIITGEKLDNITRKDLKEYLNTHNFYVYVKCGQFEKYGRCLAEVYTEEAHANNTESINAILVKEELAIPYML